MTKTYVVMKIMFMHGDITFLFQCVQAYHTVKASSAVTNITTFAPSVTVKDLHRNIHCTGPFREGGNAKVLLLYNYAYPRKEPLCYNKIAKIEKVPRDFQSAKSEKKKHDKFW